MRNFILTVATFFALFAFAAPAAFAGQGIPAQAFVPSVSVGEPTSVTAAKPKKVRPVTSSSNRKVDCSSPTTAHEWRVVWEIGRGGIAKGTGRCQMEFAIRDLEKVAAMADAGGTHFRVPGYKPDMECSSGWAKVPGIVRGPSIIVLQPWNKTCMPKGYFEPYRVR